MSAMEIAAIAWPFAFILMMWSNEWLLSRERKRADFWQKVAELHQDTVRDCMRENIAAFRLVDKAARQLLEHGDVPNELVDWMMQSKEQSERWQARAHAMGAKP